MAGQSAKKQVASNNKILKEIHRITWVSLGVSAVFNFAVGRPQNYKPFIIFSIPALLSIYTLEKTGRPVVDNSGKIVRIGQDLQQEGLTEYFFDIIYLTVIFNLISIIFNTTKIWWLYLVVPAFACYKLYGLVNAGRQLLGGGGASTSGATENDGQSGSKQPEKSKRQLKMEKRGDKPKVRYR